MPTSSILPQPSVPIAIEPEADGSGSLRILDSVPAQTYVDFAQIACSICNATMAMLLLVDGGRLTFKAQVGISAARLPTLLGLCSCTAQAQCGEPAEAPAGLGFHMRIPFTGPGGEALAIVCVFNDQPLRLSPAQHDGLRALARLATGMLERRHKALQVKQLLADRERRNVELHRLAHQDALTGLHNRGALEALLDDPDSRLFADHYSIAMLDVDHFKQVNDRHGHAVGDEVLQRVAAVIAECVRGNDIACRYGGEEFAMLMPLTHIAGARTVLERVRLGVQSLDLPFQVTLSAGLAVSRPGAGDPRQVLVQADQALYLAKQRGRNRVVAYED